MTIKHKNVKTDNSKTLPPASWVGGGGGKHILKFLLSFIIYWDFPGGSDGKESACRVGDMSLIPGSG